MFFLVRQALAAAIIALNFRPPKNFLVGVGTWAVSWIPGELAPQTMIGTLLDTAQHVAVSRRRGRPPDRVGLALAAANVAALGVLIWRSSQVGSVTAKALTDGLGPDAVAAPEPRPRSAELRAAGARIALPFRILTPEVRVIRDIDYTDTGKRGRLDIYLPADRDVVDAPVLMQIHGGAWTVGEKEHQALPLMMRMARKGWVCVAVNYRLAPQHRFPAQIIDVKRAIRWIREHIAEYGGDPDYLAVTGGSAGGHLAALAALTPGDPAFQPGFEGEDTRVHAAVPLYGVYDLAGSTGLTNACTMRDKFLAKKVFAAAWEDAPEVYQAASPILRITPDAPDFFVLHGTSDALVAVDQARLFVARLREISRHAVVYAEFPAAQHMFDLFGSVRSGYAVRAIDRFLSWSWRRAKAAAGDPSSPRVRGE